MYSLELSTPARKYFENLRLYLITKFGEKTVKKVLHKEEDKLETLKMYPYMGIKATKFSVLLDGYSVLTDKKEYIFYRVNKVKNSIFVELMVSTKEDLGQKIKKNIL